ncbi:MAG: sensor histidine kinase, partial [Thermomicrobiaceae bacterium]|nr:sensor histidine kinase [Thermomicrobiaceae bacterium]
MKDRPRNAAGEGAVDPSYAQGSDLRWVVDALTTRRDEILERWLDAASSQPFHRDHPERTVTDHIPALFDALVATLREDADHGTDPGAPLDAPAIRKAAEGHARFRAAQGLPPAAIVVEFRLLRQEIWRALRASIPDDAPVSDVLGAEIVVNDALDGAISVGLATLITHIDEVREDFLATTVHEVRQPITVIKGTAQLALRGLRRPEPNLERIADALRRIEADADRMAEQLNTLVDVSRAAVGALDLHVATVDLARLARDTANELGPETSRRIEWRVAEGANVAGRWDPFRLQQVVRNLLSNAV